MKKLGFNFPREPRRTALWQAEQWYQKRLADFLNRKFHPIKTSNFGEYDMAVNYLTSVLEEAAAINKVAVFNIDHMAQLEIAGKDSIRLLDRVFPTNISLMKVGQCKYTLLLTEEGTVLDDLIVMRVSVDKFILVINAGHDITDESKGLIADADYINAFKIEGEVVEIEDISDQLVKIDVQGPLSYKLITELYGEIVVKNRNKPTKNMKFFTFNEFTYEDEKYYLSRTGYTNRWGWEMYLPVDVAVEQFKRIANKALQLGGLVVGLGGRDENRISAGTFGLPLNGQEYDREHTPINAPLFAAAVDMNKEDFVGKAALQAELDKKIDKRLGLFITEGIVTGRDIYRDGKRVGVVTSSINSPNVSQEKREYIGSERKNLLGADGTCAIGLGWFTHNPFPVDAEGNDILSDEKGAIRIRLEFYKTKNGEKKGKPILGYLSGDGVNPATASRALKNIQDL
ncbi:MAG: aminomethyltransferase family protein [Candidatus Cloacimonadales bacterium]